MKSVLGSGMTYHARGHRSLEDILEGYEGHGYDLPEATLPSNVDVTAEDAKEGYAAAAQGGTVLLPHGHQRATRTKATSKVKGNVNERLLKHLKLR